MNSKIAVIGYGYVGKAFARMFDDQVDRFPKTAIYDPYVDDEAINSGGPNQYAATQDDVNKCDMAVICVPTPTNAETGECDTSIVEEVFSWLKVPLVLIKSTIIPGTTDKLSAAYPDKKIVFSPEYVGEGRYFVTQRMDFQTDMKKCPFMICGGQKEHCGEVFDALVPLLGPEKSYYQCAAIEAEVIKYMENTYFGVKITFAQEMYNVCKALGADWYKVWQGWALDPRVDIMHTAIFPKARGFSGKCLPKDLNALVAHSIDKGYYPDMLVAMLKSNAKIRPDEPVRAKNI